MRKHLVFIVIILFTVLLFATFSSANPEICELDAREYMQALTSKEFAGRSAIASSIEIAAKYLENKLLVFGVKSLDANGFRQTFDLPKSKNRSNSIKAFNIIGFIPGNDELLKTQFIVIGAHYDHLGQKKDSDEYYPGADDNASGVSALLEIAENLVNSKQNKRSVIICFFTAEEIGLFGSEYFIKHPPVSREQIVAMINLDMVGRMQNNQLAALGTGSSPVWKPAIEEASKNADLFCPQVPNSISGSDHVSFYLKKLPVLFLITGGSKEMHTVNDTIDRINFPGLIKASNMVVELIKTLDKTPEKFIFTEVKEQKHYDRTQGKPKKKLGIIPDFAVATGMGIGSVVPGGIAESAGLKEGDVIIKWNENNISTIEDYTAQLAKTKSGDKVKLTVTRGEEILVIEVQF